MQLLHYVLLSAAFPFPFPFLSLFTTYSAYLLLTEKKAQSRSGFGTGPHQTSIFWSPLVLCKCFPVGLPSQDIFEIKFFDYFCKCHEGRGLGKKLGLFDHLNYRKKTTSIYKRDERCGFYFKNQPKETLRGGVLEDRKNLTCCLLCFATWLPQGTG